VRRRRKGGRLGWLVRKEPDGRCFGEVAYVEGQVPFRMDDLEFKPRGGWTAEDVTEQFIVPLKKPDKSFMLDKIGKECIGPSLKGALS